MPQHLQMTRITERVSNNGGSSLQIAFIATLMRQPPSVIRLHDLQLGEKQEQPGCLSMSRLFGRNNKTTSKHWSWFQKNIVISFTEASCNL